MRRPLLGLAVELCIGLAVSSAHPLGLVVASGMPALAMHQQTRRGAYLAALCYYAGAAWPLIPGARNFFGPRATVLTALLLWAVACALLASPWPLIWWPKRSQFWWRAPLGLALGVVPPLGIIGWASPLTAAGLLFPGTEWLGLAACALTPGLLAVWPRSAGLGVAVGAILCNVTCAPVPPAPPGWVAIDTLFGAIAHGPSTSTVEYEAAQAIQLAALRTDATVLLFPETVVPTWTAATEAFWKPTLDRLRSSGKIIIVGARLPESGVNSGPISSGDYAAALTVLRGGAMPIISLRRSAHGLAYDNAAVVRGAETAVIHQRIPVPIGMWKPLQPDGARLHMLGPGVIHIANRRVALLICYEQLLVWPVLTSLREEPDVIIGMANDHWAVGTPIPQYQELAMLAWSRLFGLPHLSATNR